MTQVNTETDALPTYKKAALQVLAYKCIRETVNSVLARFELNTTQWIILGILYESNTGLRITDIAHRMQVEVPLITSLTQPMLGTGLIRNRISKIDHRAKPLALTMHGKAMIGRIEPLLAKHLQPLEKGLDQQELTRYFQALEAFIDNAEVVSD